MPQDPNLPAGCTNAEIDRHMGAGVEDCPDCEGTGKLGRSNCCDDHFYENTDICVQCKEHAENQECEECGGTGQINVAERKAEAKHEAEIERWELNKEQ